MEGRRGRVLLAVLVTALGLGLTTGGAAAARVARVEVSSTAAGSVLTNARGYVLFIFRREGRGISLCVRTRTCTADWPFVTTTGRPVAGVGLDRRLLGTIRYRGRLRVVTYAGWPLHTYRYAYSAQTSVIDIGISQYGGPWYALDPSGKIVR